MKNLKIKIFFAWYDFWIGWYFDRKYGYLYVCLLPTIVIRIWNREYTRRKIYEIVMEEPYG